MVPSSQSFFFIIFSVLLLFTIVEKKNAGAAPNPKPDIEPSKLVDKVCKQASDYTFCVNSLYSDSRTPQADQYTLAYISVGLAYNYATSTQLFISELLKNVSSAHWLQKCVGDYNKIVSLIETANNDLNSETFFLLADYAAKASDSADHCQAAFPSNPSLTARTKDLKGLCQIFGIIGNLYGGGRS